jgi:hypothetical protein
VDTIIQLTLGQVLGGTAFLITCVGLLQWLISNWLKIRLEQSIRHEYDKQLEEYKFAISKRDRIANIASFFSLWIKYRGHERKWLNDRDLIDYYRELTQMSFELALWVDDEDLLKEVMKRLKNEDGSENTVELLLRAKGLISENKNSTLGADNITIWPADIKFIEEGPK